MHDEILPEGLDHPPIILLARGGSGSRLLSLLAKDLGIFIGNELNESGDSLEMVDTVWTGAERKLSAPSQESTEATIQELRQSANSIRNRCSKFNSWGFKLPESMLLIEELDRAFPNAYYLHLIRDPLTTCLRRTHLTARTDNPIGRLALGASYRYCRRDVDLINSDSPALHMCFTTIHQVRTVHRYCQEHCPERYLVIRFEQLIANPKLVTNLVSEKLHLKPIDTQLEKAVDLFRAMNPDQTYSTEVCNQVSDALASLRHELEYIIDQTFPNSTHSQN